MAEKTKSSNGILNTLALVLVVACILLVLGFQVQQVAGIVSPPATPTPIQAYSVGGSGITVGEEDVIVLPTPAD
jgi:hypothetical protein